MNNIVEWMACNKLTINVDKTYSMMFTNRLMGLDDLRQLSIDGCEIKFVQS